MLPPAQSALAKPSLYQRRILEFVRSGTGHGVVRATAGAGKTTTLVQVASTLPADLRVCFLAFARDAANELRQRLPRGVEAMTVHKLGLRTLACHLRGRGVKQLEVDASKYRALVRAELADVKMGYAVSEETLSECEEYLMDLVHYARLNLTDTKDPEEVRALAIRYNFTPPEHVELEDEMHERLRIVLRKGMQQALTRSLLRGPACARLRTCGTPCGRPPGCKGMPERRSTLRVSGTGKLGLVDFTDMIYLPYILKMEPIRYDFVCVDEAQDYSALALRFTMRLVGDGGRLLFVGDPRQSIFGFAGADTDALERIVQHTQATVLPLSITYRCPRAHVELARLVAPEIEASPHAQEGRVFWIKDSMLEKWVYEGDMIICRNNAPLVGTCLRLVRSGKRAYVKGRDLAKQLQTVSRKVFAGGFDNYYGKLDRFAREEEARLRRALRGQANTDTVVARRLDLVDCLYYLVEDLVERILPSLEKLEALIHKTFGEEGPAVMLSTVHRAKGKEANRVVILYPELMPAVYARTSEAVRGEACVQFVALTRARRDLVFVESPPREEPMGLLEEA